MSAYADGLFRRAFFLTSHRETAEDLVQDTFLAAAQQLAAFKGDSSPKTWLFSILHHKTADYFRRKMRQPTILTDDFFAPNGRWATGKMPGGNWHENPEQLLDNPEFQTTLERCFDQLPETWRIAFLMKFLENKKGAEICQDLNLSSSNYWQILHRTKLQLRLCLEVHWFNR